MMSDFVHYRPGPCGDQTDRPEHNTDDDTLVTCPVCRRRNGWDRRTLTDGTQVYPGHAEKVASGPRQGQQKDYVVLAESERARGFVRPYRDSYRHSRCGGVTNMGRALSETYARDPSFYSGTFCANCGSHFPVGEDGEFVWTVDDQKVGT